jgi:hypothetical protein
MSKPYSWMYDFLGHYSWLKLVSHVDAHVHLVTLHFDYGELGFDVVTTF